MVTEDEVMRLCREAYREGLLGAADAIDAMNTVEIEIPPDVDVVIAQAMTAARHATLTSAAQSLRDAADNQPSLKR
jgi:hypothetical protein